MARLVWLRRWAYRLRCVAGGAGGCRFILLLVRRGSDVAVLLQEEGSDVAVPQDVLRNARSDVAVLLQDARSGG